MSPAFSVYLDLVRFAAALAVFLHHLASPTFTDGVLPDRLGNYGPAAVTLFFVLSGYVIAYVVDEREKDWTRYTVSRLARMYSVLLVALAVTLVSDQLGQHLAGAFYQLPKALNKPESATSYAAVLGFVNEYRVFHWQGITAGTNSVLWSLSFEATYYVLAGLVLFAPLAVAIPLSLVLLLCAGRTVAAMAPLWALGYALYRYRDALRISARLAAPVFAASVLALWFCADMDELGITSAKLLWFPFGRMEANRNMLADYLIAASFAIHLVSARALLARVAAFPAPRLIRWLGSLTFPLYCLHYPLIVLGSAVSPWPNTHWARALAITVLVFCVVVALTPATEQLKLWLRALLQKVLTRKQLRPVT